MLDCCYLRFESSQVSGRMRLMCRLAIEAGADIVPVYNFGQSQV